MGGAMNQLNLRAVISGLAREAREAAVVVCMVLAVTSCRHLGGDYNIPAGWIGLL
jgi:hypothetical protein